MKHILFLIILGAFVFHSCIPPDKETYADIDEEKYFYYNEGDTVYFNGDTNQDTLLISHFEQGYDVSDDVNYTEIIFIDYFNLKDQYVGNLFRTNGYGTIFWGKSNYLRYYYKEYTGLVYNIDDITFDNVFFFENVEEEGLETDVNKLYYNDNYGIIAYELYNGEVYEINVSRLPSKPE